MMMAQFIGIVFGLSICGAVFINQALQSLQKLLPDTISETQIRALITGTSSNAIDVIPESYRTDAIAAVVQSLCKVFILAYVGAAAALVASVFLSRRRAFHNERKA